MLYFLLYPLRDIFPFLGNVRYITFRATAAAITAFLVGMVLGPFVIRAFRKSGMAEDVNKKDVDRLILMHKSKKGTPTMGGFIISGAILFSTFLWGKGNTYMYLAVLVLVYLTILGFVDDYIKLHSRKSSGVRISTKLVLQFVLGAILGILLFRELPGLGNTKPLVVPFYEAGLYLSYVTFLFLVLLVTVGTTNAVNLTDGLDGLAVGCTIMSAMVFLVVSYVVGRIDFSSYLGVPYIENAGELSVLCASIVGAGLAFLWYNCHPAEIFMGDTGSLPLGGLIGYVAVVCRHELLLFIVGGVFVIEAVSVMLQVASYRLTGKRIFLIAPLHHHYELKGLKETKITLRFYIVAAILAVFSIATLKLR